MLACDQLFDIFVVKIVTTMTLYSKIRSILKFDLKLKLKSPLLLLLYRLVVVALFYQVCRVLFVAINWNYFSDLTTSQMGGVFKGGFVFDLVAILYTNSLLIILSLLPFRFRSGLRYQSLLKYITIWINGLFFAVNIADSTYYQFTLKRATGSIFKFIAGEDNIWELFSQFVVDYWSSFLIYFILLYLFVSLVRVVGLSKKEGSWSVKNYMLSSVVFLISIYLSICGIRGGFGASTRPIAMNNAGKYVTKSSHSAVVLNSTFTILRTLGSKEFEFKEYYSQDQLNSLFNPIHKGSGNEASFDKRNIVVIILESFAKDAMGYFHKDKLSGSYKGYTPFLDSLSQHSLYSINSYSNGRKSIDALPSVMASIPYFGTPYILTHHSTNRINSISSSLKKTGYRTSFFHGAPNGSMGFDGFCSYAGVDSYYGKSEYGNNDDFDGIWGIWDEPFLQYTASMLDTITEPFCSTIFTLSSHHPFKVPAKYENQFPMGTQPLHQCIGYSDNALRKFFDSASKMSWFDNTIFVITADHTSQVEFAESKSLSGVLEIPILIYDPRGEIKGEVKQTVQQSDIFPTIMGLLGYPYDYLAFGSDLLDSNKPHVAVSYSRGAYQIISEELLLIFDGDRAVELYDLTVDPLNEVNILGDERFIEQQKRLESTLKAYLQSYIGRLQTNTMFVE